MTDIDWTLSDSDERMANMCASDIRARIKEGDAEGATRLRDIQREMLRLAEVRLRQLDSEKQALVRAIVMRRRVLELAEEEDK